MGLLETLQLEELLRFAEAVRPRAGGTETRKPNLASQHKWGKRLKPEPGSQERGADHASASGSRMQGAEDSCCPHSRESERLKLLCSRGGAICT